MSDHRTNVVEQMYQGYLDAHDRLVAGTNPEEIPALAEFSVRLEEDSVFHFPSLGLELRGRAAIEHFMIEIRQKLGLRETSDRVLQHGNLVVAFNRTTTVGSDAAIPVVALFRFRGETVSEFWGFAGAPDVDE